MNEPQDVSIPDIRVETSKLGQSRVLTTVKGLAEYLLYDWPKKGGDKHLKAREACVAAFEGKLSGGACRIAFLEACKEAGVFIFDDSTGRPGPRTKPSKRPQR